MGESTFGGPVSEALEAELRGWVGKKRLVVWLDLDDHYSPFVQRLVEARKGEALPYEVLTFGGSHLELMLALDGVVSGTEKPNLVVHLPGFNEASVRNTPLFSIYAPGVRWRKAPDTLVREAAAGRVHPDDVEAYLDTGTPTLEDADRWLEDALRGDGSDAPSIWRSLSPVEVVDRLLQPGEVTGEELVPAFQRLRVALGIPDEWTERLLGSRRLPATTAEACSVGAGWALAVEYVHDLQRDPVDAVLAHAGNLSGSVVQSCLAVASHLRDRQAGRYEGLAGETQAALADEVASARAEDLGQIDTFRFEEERVLEGALNALADDRWQAAQEWADRRVSDAREARSFWLRNDVHRTSAWELIRLAATLGSALEAAGRSMGDLRTHGAAVRAYAERGAVVDRAHRHLEQARKKLLEPQVPVFARLRDELDRLRRTWEAWADGWAVEFNELCRREGFLPEAKLQQRQLFDDVVVPLAKEHGRTALFLVDALRFEMAMELLEELEGATGTRTQLEARLAELPTVTEVGMNALAPVARNGCLDASLTTPDGGKFTGFSTGQFRVYNPATRKKAIHDRVGGHTCPWLELAEVVATDSDALKKQIASAQLVVVHSLEIDEAGEKGAGLSVFDDALRDVRTASSLLRQAGVKRFVVTSDHGFLLRYGSAHSPQPHGRKIDVNRRHVVTSQAADVDGTVRVPLSDLQYDGVEGHLVFPETTNVFDRGNKSSEFVHGGNSLQERVIPVLTVVHRERAGSSNLRYTVQSEVREQIAGMHCIRARVDVVASGALAFASADGVELLVVAADAPGVTVELVQARDGARVERSALRAEVGKWFEVFLRLSGPDDVRAALEFRQGGTDAPVEPSRIPGRFDVEVVAGRQTDEARATKPETTSAHWLEELPEGGVRDVFSHLAEHGTVTEEEATRMLGGPRKLRRFARNFEKHADLAPFRVSIRVVGNLKRYVREGNE